MLQIIYFGCFCITLLVLLFLLAYGRTVSVDIVLLSVVIAVSNGGFFALSKASNLEEAILANNITYGIGLFSPILVLLVICNICRIAFPNILKAVLIGVQILIYFCVCTTGHLTIFYQSIELHFGEAGSYVTKTYGPVHDLYLLSVLVYTASGIVVVIYALNKRTALVSRRNLDMILFTDILTVGLYLLERLLHLKYEMMPLVSTFSIIIISSIVIRVYFFSVYYNQNMFEDEIIKNGYIMFDKNLRYMGANNTARQLYPELNSWELEKKIPGNGGRFNTFLRQSLMKYVQEGKIEATKGKTYEYKGELYCYDIGVLLRKGSSIRGYYIKVSNLTDVLR
ncbi:histidine kinase N-terminal 7TM domain-containing protein [Pseudobutyrivibrio sp.]|uniref:histidine kinase N-terminal 7TM domain-containing protein n=1 Tax=Pseudobutyrivibrio sp. TaxID=2014367 RepID=UPI001D386DB9|nr:histidine kinase N-terminal 7TM domain-containing protein [Pseudobutyrivibrio sp.]MBE5910652.1 hypothetical protein [Pseudobutyrivibrio sp.]